jgi:hypothetical protein
MDTLTPSFARSVLSGSNGGSTGRVATMLIVVFALLWVTYLVARHDAIPDLTGLTIWVTTTTTTLFGVSKVAEVVQAATQKEPTP